MIWSTFEGFVLLDTLKGVFNLGKISKGGMAVPHILKHFWGNFDHFSIFYSPIKNFSVQRLNTCFKANNMTVYTVFCAMLNFVIYVQNCSATAPNRCRHGICQKAYTGKVFKDQILPKSV